MLELLSDNGKIILFLLTAILAVAGYVLRQHVTTVNKLNTEAVRKSDLEAKHQENAKVLESIRTMVSQTQMQLEVVGEIRQRMTAAERNIQDLRDFKHEKVEGAIRYVGMLQEEKPWNETKSHIARLENKIDAYAKTDSDTRHKTASDVQLILVEIQRLSKSR